MPASEIDVTGIPIHPAFAEPAIGPLSCRQGLVGDRPVLLQLCGGFGVGPVEAVFNSLLAVEKPFEIVVVCGRNAELKEASRNAAVRSPSREDPWPNAEIDQLMGCADLVISKPGGLTTSECLARGLPMVIVNPIPGQESRNSDFLLESGAGVKVNHVCTLTAKINDLLANPDRLKQLHTQALTIGHPTSAFEVARRSLAVIGVKTEAVVPAVSHV